jgi:acyl transferase domain-containing protein/3-hydroxymyristoyl/3-hydroxydecanoyl-(acyl carrier protein) dehydratase
MTAPFEPIAIVGQGCVVPGALTPAALWDVFRAGKDVTSSCPPGRWRLSPEDVLRSADSKTPDGAVSDRGGYVRDFESVFDPDGFGLPAERVRALDPGVQWLLHAGREALRDARLDRDDRRGGLRIGACIGNLSFPTDSVARWTESYWLDAQGPDFLGGRARELAGLERPDPRDRFMSGLPALLLAEALGLDAGGFALDAACASSLYAIKLACDRLHDRNADAMLAGAVCRADDLFIHVGFTALQALSPTGRSRPFHREADGLLPAEGAALLVLRRLEDAVADGDPILGVIRGAGLSNDGRSNGFLVPSARAQVRAIRAALDGAGLEPADISLIECHATGTPVGDATEIQSMSEVFGGLARIPIGSAKSNLGHALTVAGTIGVMKVLGAMREGVRPASLHAGDSLPALGRSPFRLLADAEPWEAPGPRRAGVSAFGFGGNNAHLIVEEWAGSRTASPPGPLSFRSASPGKEPPGDAPRNERGCRTSDGLPRQDVAIVAIGACVGGGEDLRDFADALLRGAHEPGSGQVALSLDGLRFPPSDLAQTLPQQLLVLRAAGEAIGSARSIPAERTGVYVGMECDAIVARGGLRARLGEFVRAWNRAGMNIPSGWLEQARAASGEPLTAAGVVGKMPNIVTNRINRQFDLAGPSFSVSSEEASGLDALEIGCRALEAGEIDAAVVGAVDISREPAHEAAARAALPADRRAAGDAALVLVLKRLTDARRDGDELWAVLERGRPPEPVEGPVSANGTRASSLFGHAHAASGLLQVAAAAVACRYRVQWPDEAGASGPWTTTVPDPSIEVSVTPMLGGTRSVTLHADRQTPPRSAWTEDVPRLHVFSGADRREVLTHLTARRSSSEGPARLVLLATESQLDARAEEAQRILETSAPAAAGVRLADGIFFRERPIGGDLAFVFTGPAGAYRGMGRDLLLAFPELLDKLGRFGVLDDAWSWVFAKGDDASISSNDKLWGASFLSQIHALFSREIVGLSPQAAIGFCSGETNALFAMGAWHDIAQLRQEILAEQVYEREIGGEFAVARRAWEKRGLAPSAWESWRVTVPEDRLRAALANETDAHLTIVNAPGDFIVAGRAEACARVIARAGAERVRPLGYNVTIHSPEMEEYAATWRRLHHRATAPVPGVRFYTHATCSHYEPTTEAVADALLGQALRTVDFPRLIQRAWDDGVRVFVEHGPQGGCSSWIRRTLGDREHLALPLDLPGESPFGQALRTIASLVAAGVAVDVDRLNARLEQMRPPRPPRRNERSWPLHPAPIRLPPLPLRSDVAQTTVAETSAVHRMPPAPWVPPILETEQETAPVEPASPVVRLADGPPSPLVEQFQQYAATMVEAHKAYVRTAEAAFRRVLSPGSADVPSALGGRGVPPLPRAGATARASDQPNARTSNPSDPSDVKKRACPGSAPIPKGGGTPPFPRADGTSALPGRRLNSHTLPRPRQSSTGPRFTRAQLETLASGEISSVFGPLFKGQDGYRRQVRMPMPPLLLADRVTGIDAEPGKLATGTLWTETDIRPDAWYLSDGHMPMGILIESGQADLLLISWMGIDALNKSERVYRLLGCELMLHGGLPKVGDSLEYEIHIDGHAQQGDVRLFLFHYDLRVNGQLRMTVRNGQAGFFTDEELRTSAGVLWRPETAEYSKQARVAPPRLKPRSSYAQDQIVALSEGRVFDCFGPGFEITEAQVRPPKIQGGRMRLFDEVLELDPTGGPWKRGYMKARARVTPDHWTMQGHFKNDPCMPGTLMCEAGFQCMSFYLIALGFTLDRDGWRFEPAPGELYDLRCRGQVTPTSRELIYELFVEELVGGENPTLYVDLLGTVDGLPAFHGRRLAVRLVQDWPLSTRTDMLDGYVGKHPVAKLSDGFAFDYRAILASAWGRPSDAFGPTAAPFEGLRRIPRLPGPPYLFMTRVAETEGQFLGMKSGAVARVEYDVPSDAWYFAENGAPTMPLAVLMEAALQPCGWLTAYVGCPFKADHNLSFRNLEGTATALGEIRPDSGRLETQTKLTSLVNNGHVMLESFDVTCSIAGSPVYKMTTRFGHFLPESLAEQVGLPTTDEDRARLAEPGPRVIDLRARPPRFFAGSLRLASERLLMLDRITGVWPSAGRAGLGRIRAERSIHPSDWFFKLHFYEDPVQAGSLGIEAMVQVLQAFMLERDLGEGIENPRFEPIALNRTFRWKYRGQVSPHNKLVVVEAEITSLVREERSVLITADASLWVDGLRIYEASDFPMRIVPGGGAP